MSCFALPPLVIGLGTLEGFFLLFFLSFFKGLGFVCACVGDGKEWTGKRIGLGWAGLGWLADCRFFLFLNTLVCLALCPLFLYRPVLTNYTSYQANHVIR
ncbi:hypothetical protein IWZ03DRAFT_237698 [Phyllosticta citriasiana]|uniref:Uncharacterized protein n=1 Tax=Phyllosticta citriasiana TaxID=595635 RepID=A0ABR1KFQ3_9PEZI